jgi:hypothetical protein
VACYVLESFDLVQGAVDGSCEHGNEHSDSIALSLGQTE